MEPGGAAEDQPEQQQTSQLDLRECWNRWKQFLAVAKLEKETRFRLLVMHRKQELRLSKLSLRVLKEYVEYRRQKRTNKLQLYYAQERTLMRKGLKGLVMYFRRLGQFSLSLQLLYCKHLQRRYFSHMVSFKKSSPKAVQFRIQVFQNRLRTRRTLGAFAAWRNAVDQNRQVRLLMVLLSELQSRLLRDNVANFFISLKNQAISAKAPVHEGPKLAEKQEDYDRLFEKRRKFTPIREVRPVRRTESQGQEEAQERGPHTNDSPRRTQLDPNPVFRNTQSRPGSGQRLLANLIALKQAELRWFEDSLFQGDQMYARFADKLRAELGQYLQATSDRYP